MTVDEALAIVETVLDYEQLNKVQELVFRQSWEGRSYIEIARSNGYEHDYIKDAGAKLWKLLSKAFGEKVKKDNVQSVLKRYLGKNQINLYGNQAIQVNLSGANLSGACISETRICANLIETDLCQANLNKLVKSDEAITLDKKVIQDEAEHQQKIQYHSEDIILWNGLHFRSPAQVKIAEALDRTGILFIPNSQMRLTTPEGRQNQQANFLIFHQGKLGILEVGDETSPQDNLPDEIRTISLIASGIYICKQYSFAQCNEQPDEVVQEFLDILIQT
jgi:Pentapeptide repeats (8 copies)